MNSKHQLSDMQEPFSEQRYKWQRSVPNFISATVKAEHREADVHTVSSILLLDGKTLDDLWETKKSWDGPWHFRVKLALGRVGERRPGWLLSAYAMPCAFAAGKLYHCPDSRMKHVSLHSGT